MQSCHISVKRNLKPKQMCLFLKVLYVYTLRCSRCKIRDCFTHFISLLTPKTSVDSRDRLPRDELDEVLVERDAGFSVKDGAERRSDEVRRDDSIFSVAEYTLETSLFTGCLHRRLDLVVGRLR